MPALVLLLIVFYCQLIFLTPFFTKNLCAISGAIIYNNPFNNDTPPKFRFNERIESYVLDIVFFLSYVGVKIVKVQFLKDRER